MPIEKETTWEVSMQTERAVLNSLNLYVMPDKSTNFDAPIALTTGTLDDITLSKGKKGAGKGFSWNEDEQLALSRAAAIACADPAIGSQMSHTQLGGKIISCFSKEMARPLDDCTASKDWGDQDGRRWDGRSADECLKMWTRIKREYIKFKKIWERILQLSLTGDPTDTEINRCASLEFSEGKQMKIHLYDCINNETLRHQKAFSVYKGF